MLLDARTGFNTASASSSLSAGSDLVKYHWCYHQVAEAIRSMVVRGAPAIGITAAYGLAIAQVFARVMVFLHMSWC